MNRIVKIVAAYEARIAERLATGQVTTEKLNALGKANDMGMEEYAMFQERKSLAVASGKLTADEGMTVYGYLGTSLDTFNGQSVAVKCALTQLFGELVGVRA